MSINKETSVLELVINGKQAETSMNGLTNSIKAAEREFRKMREADDPKAYAEVARNIRVQKEALNEMRKSINGVNREAEQFKTTWKDIAKGVLASGFIQQGIGYLKDFAVSAVNTYASFQKMGSVLANALGSKSEANKALKDLQRFASETPFQLEELTASYLKFVNRGMQPTMAQMTKFGDLASSQGKSFDQLTEAILDATTGEFERLKEFGIRASKNGNMVALSFKGLTQEVKLTGGAIQGALEQFAAMPGVAGSMESMGKTLSQVFSNFGDNVDALSVRFGSATGGFIYKVVSGLSAMIGKMADTRTESERLTDELIKTDRYLKSLEKSVNPLVKRYEELKSKTKLNKDEHEELQTVMNDIGNLLPTAVTKWDKYGNAIEISTAKVKDAIEAQKVLQKVQYADAIKAKEDELKKVEGLQKQLEGKINYGKKTTGLYGGGSVTENLNAQEIADLAENMRNLADKAKTLQFELKVLKGENLDELNTTDEKIRKQQEEQRLKDEAAAAAKLAAEEAKKAAKEAKKQAEQALKQREKDIETLKETLTKEMRAFEIEGMDPLDQIVSGITDKFDVLIAQAEKLGQTDVVKNLKELRDKNVNSATNKFTAEQAKKDKEEELKAATTISDAYYQIEKNKLGQQYADGEITKKEYDKKILALEAERITALIEINKDYGVSIAELETQLTDLKISEKDREVENAKKKEQEKRDFQIEMATEASNAIFSILQNSRQAQLEDSINTINQQRENELSNKNLTERQKEAINAKYEKRIAEEKTKAFKKEQLASVAQAVINGALAITKATAQTGVLAPFVIPTIIGTTAAQIAVIATQKAPKYAKGGILEGPSHANGGMAVLDGQGNKVAELEGGETILSAGFTRNNPRLINDLLYQSQRQASNSVAINTSEAISANRYFESGGKITPPDWKQTVTNNTNFDMSETNALLAALATEFSEFKKKPFEFPMRTFYEADAVIKNNINDASA